MYPSARSKHHTGSGHLQCNNDFQILIFKVATESSAISRAVRLNEIVDQRSRRVCTRYRIEEMNPLLFMSRVPLANKTEQPFSAALMSVNWTISNPI